MSSRKAKPVDRAKPLLRKSRDNDAQKIASTHSTMTAMQGSTLWNANPALQTVATAWSAKAGELDANSKVILDLRSKLATAQAAQETLRRDWTDLLSHLTTNVATVTQGSADQVRDLGFDVLTRGKPGGLLSAPTGFATAHSGVRGEVVVSWNRGNVKYGFVVQHATDIANPATISTAIPSTKAKFKLSGLASGSVVYVRAATIDPASPVGQSPWSDWFAASAL
jgi:hypothetical protein